MSSYCAAGVQVTVTPPETTVSSIGYWVHMATAKHPERVPLQLGDRSLTYSELSALSREGARALQSEGVDPGARVALELADPLEFAIAIHACLLHGAAAVPIDLRLSAEERAARAAHAASVVSGPLEGGSVAWPRYAGPGDVLPQTATVMHTSGTTSAPKPVELTYGNWLAQPVGSAGGGGVGT